MLPNLARVGFVVAAVALAGCTESQMNSHGARGGKEIPARLIAEMSKKGMSKSSPVLARIFKEESKVEVWKQKANGRYDLLATYDICKYSGELGPKFVEGDRQAPEGFYSVRPAQMNPNSSYHLSFNMGYPNAFDRANGRTGSNLMVHGACSSSGCYSMNDPQIEEIYAVAREAFKGGQQEFQIQAFPFRMTAANMARYRDDPNYKFWTMLKEGYDHFEITKVPPKVDVCEKRYVFNRIPEGGAGFNPTGACPPSTQPESLTTAYQSFSASYDAAYTTALAKDAPPPRPTINGLKEAKLVSEWTKKRARGERITIEPPSMQADGSVIEGGRMGRIDSPAGRKMAELEAAKAEKERLAAEKKAAALEKKRQREAARLAKVGGEASAPTAAPDAAPPVAKAADAPALEASQPEPEQKAGLLGGARKRLKNIFGS